MSVDPVDWKIQTLRGQRLERGLAIRQLNQSGLDRAAARRLLSRKRAALDDLMKRGCGDDIFRDARGMLLPRSETTQGGTTVELKDRIRAMR